MIGDPTLWVGRPAGADPCGRGRPGWSGAYGDLGHPAGHEELARWLVGEEMKHRAKTKLKLKAVGGLAGILLQNRDEINKKYEGMV